MSLHLHPLFSRSFGVMAPAPAPMHSERIDWWPAGSSRMVPEGRLLLKTRRDGVREGFMDGAGTWRLADRTVVQAQDVLAWADMPEGPL